jgi:hypothetical protein
MQKHGRYIKVPSTTSRDENTQLKRKNAGWGKEIIQKQTDKLEDKTLSSI